MAVIVFMIIIIIIILIIIMTIIIIRVLKIVIAREKIDFVQNNRTTNIW